MNILVGVVHNVLLCVRRLSHHVFITTTRMFSLASSITLNTTGPTLAEVFLIVYPYVTKVLYLDQIMTAILFELWCGHPIQTVAHLGSRKGRGGKSSYPCYHEGAQRKNPGKKVSQMGGMAHWPPPNTPLNAKPNKQIAVVS